MFKRFMLFTGALTLSVLLSAGVGEAATVLKIGVVDLQKALNATSEGVAAKERLRQKHEAKQEQVDARKAELDALEERIKSPVLSEEAKKELEQEYMTKRAALIEFVTEAREEEERENQQLSSRILDGLVEIAREVAQRDNYSVLLETTGGGVIFFQPDMDLTEEIIRIYNERRQGDQAK